MKTYKECEKILKNFIGDFVTVYVKDAGDSFIFARISKKGFDAGFDKTPEDVEFSAISKDGKKYAVVAPYLNFEVFNKFPIIYNSGWIPGLE